MNRKGLCTNFGNCKNADSKIALELSIAADFVCPECGRDLTEVKGRNPIPWPKVLLFAGIPTVIIALVLFFVLGKKHSGTTETPPNNSAQNKDIVAAPPPPPASGSNGSVAPPPPPDKNNNTHGGNTWR